MEKGKIIFESRVDKKKRSELIANDTTACDAHRTGLVKLYVEPVVFFVRRKIPNTVTSLSWELGSTIYPNDT